MPPSMSARANAPPRLEHGAALGGGPLFEPFLKVIQGSFDSGLSRWVRSSKPIGGISVVDTRGAAAWKGIFSAGTALLFSGLVAWMGARDVAAIRERQDRAGPPPAARTASPSASESAALRSAANGSGAGGNGGAVMTSRFAVPPGYVVVRRADGRLVAIPEGVWRQMQADAVTRGS